MRIDETLSMRGNQNATLREIHARRHQAVLRYVPHHQRPARSRGIISVGWFLRTVIDAIEPPHITTRGRRRKVGALNHVVLLVGTNEILVAHIARHLESDVVGSTSIDGETILVHVVAEC